MYILTDIQNNPPMPPLAAQIEMKNAVFCVFPV